MDFAELDKKITQTIESGRNDRKETATISQQICFLHSRRYYERKRLFKRVPEILLSTDSYGLKARLVFLNCN